MTPMPDPFSDFAAPAGAAIPPAASGKPARRWPWVLALLFVLLVGAAASLWAGQRWWLPARGQQDTRPPQAAESARVADLESRVARLEQAQTAAALAQSAVSAQAPVVAAGAGAGAYAARIAALEAQAGNLVAADTSLSGRLEALTQDVQRVGGSVQASDMQIRELFLLSVVRRSVAAGRSLSPLVDSLLRSYRQQFPAAIEALTTWSASPHNRADLAARLETLPGETMVAAGSGTWWERLRARLSGLITVRDGDATRPDTAELHGAASKAMAHGDLAAAIGLVERLPAGSVRDAWLGDARTLLAAEQALDMLEDSAIGRTIDIAANAPPAQGANTLPPVNAPGALAAPGG